MDSCGRKGEGIAGPGGGKARFRWREGHAGPGGGKGISRRDVGHSQEFLLTEGEGNNEQREQGNFFANPTSLSLQSMAVND